MIFKERRIIYDYEKYGNSPNCLGKDKFIPNQHALQQGAGLTEQDELAGLKDVKVQIIQNEECYQKIKSASKRQRNKFKGPLDEGINDGILCTLGIENEAGVLQVRTYRGAGTYLNILWTNQVFLKLGVDKFQK